MGISIGASPGEGSAASTSDAGSDFSFLTRGIGASSSNLKSSIRILTGSEPSTLIIAIVSLCDTTTTCLSAYSLLADLTVASLSFDGVGAPPPPNCEISLFNTSPAC